MTKADFDRFRTILLTLRNRLTGDVTHLKDETIRDRAMAAGANRSAQGDLADQGSDIYDYEFNLGLLQNQEQTLAEIREALDRIDKGTFGRCEECQELIPRPRLQALPYTRHCVSCARKLQ